MPFYGQIEVRSWHSQSENADATSHRRYEKERWKGQTYLKQHQQTLIEMPFLKREVHAVKNSCNDVQQVMAALEDKMASSEITISNSNTNMIYASVTQKIKLSRNSKTKQFRKPKSIETLRKSTSLRTPIQASLKTAPKSEQNSLNSSHQKERPKRSATTIAIYIRSSATNRTRQMSPWELKPNLFRMKNSSKVPSHPCYEELSADHT